MTTTTATFAGTTDVPLIPRDTLFGNPERAGVQISPNGKWISYLAPLDGVLNVSGHRLGTMEIESALVANPLVAEAAVVGVPHSIKGQGIYAFVILKSGATPSDELKKELVMQVRKEIGPIATPDIIHFAPALPKTRSGKIMRRILRKIANDEFESLGDISTLADPEVVGNLIQCHKDLTSN